MNKNKKEEIGMKLRKWKRIKRKGIELFGNSFNTGCIGQACEDCSNNDANTAGSFCAGRNCGWCHDCKTVYVDGVPCGQDYSVHND